MTLDEKLKKVKGIFEEYPEVKTLFNDLDFQVIEWDENYNKLKYNVPQKGKLSFYTKKGLSGDEMNLALQEALQDKTLINLILKDRGTVKQVLKRKIKGKGHKYH